MPQQTASQTARYLDAFGAFERNGASADPAWVRDLRRDAAARFADLGFPTARRGNEEWKYTDVRPIARAPFSPLSPVEPPAVTAQELERLTVGDSRWSRLVFVDGCYAPDLSDIESLPSGVSLLSLADAMATRPELVREHLARHAAYQDNAFTALNTAFLHEGAFLHVPDRTEAPEPVHLVFLSTAKAAGAALQPRVLVLAGRDSSVTIVESHGALSDAGYLTNAVTEVAVGDGARVRHYRVQQESEEAYAVGNTHVTLGRDSTYASVVTDLGGGLVRNNLNVLTGDEGSHTTLNGLYLVTRSQHVDNQVIIDHAKPHTTSRELYKGVLSGRSRSVFHGSIVVREGAQKVSANQADKNLLLSNEAEADTKPAFWIYADDVRCAHGAACGQLDEAALFYLRSRGIGEQEARMMLVRGFVAEIVEGIEHQAVRAHVEGLVAAKLAQM
jgi:Fe-S cluster assembly protein SufD